MSANRSSLDFIYQYAEFSIIQLPLGSIFSLKYLQNRVKHASIKFPIPNDLLNTDIKIDKNELHILAIKIASLIKKDLYLTLMHLKFQLLNPIIIQITQIRIPLNPKSPLKANIIANKKER